MAKPKKFMSQAAFAEHMGYKSRAYVTQLKKDGRLVFNDKGQVDVEASKIRIAETADPNRDDVKKRHAEKRETEKPAKPTREVKTSPFQKARAEKEHYQALQAKLDYEKQAGELISKQALQAALSDAFITFRQGLENLPHTISADLVGKDLGDIRLILKQAVHDALHNLERNCTQKVEQIAEQAA